MGPYQRCQILRFGGPFTGSCWRFLGFRVLMMLRYDNFQNLCLELASCLSLVGIAQRLQGMNEAKGNFRKAKGAKSCMCDHWKLLKNRRRKSGTCIISTTSHIFICLYSLYMNDTYLVGAQPSPCRPFAHHVLEKLILCSSLSTAHLSIYDLICTHGYTFK